MSDPRGTVLANLSIVDLAERLRAGVVTSLQLTEYCLDRIQLFDGKLNSFLTVTEDIARRQAALADAAFRAGRELGPLQGIPYGLKDIFDVAGVETTANSHISVGPSPAEKSCMVYDRLNRQGAVLLGKLNTHELALGGPTDELPFPVARNPWNIDYFSGASSSGSAVAVAARLLPVSFGSDTSGSIRGPASCCGVVGFKPTYGNISRANVVPLSYSLDHIGPIARSVVDCAIAAAAVAGRDPDDPTSTDPASTASAASIDSLVDTKIGVAENYLAPEAVMDEQVNNAIRRLINSAQEAGAIIHPISLPPFAEFDACGRIIMMAEAFAIHAQALTHDPLLFARPTYQRIIQGAYVSAKDYIWAQQARLRLADSFVQVMSGLDALLCPGSCFPPPRLDEFGGDWPPPRHLTATRTILANVVGAPALSLPIGLSDAGMPIGVQVIGMPHDDKRTLDVASALEALVEFTIELPPTVR